MQIKLLALFCSCLFACGVLATPASAAEVTTDCEGLQAALDDSSNDVITLDDTDFCVGHFDLPSRPITLQGAAGAENGFDGVGESQILSGTDVGETVIRNLTFTNGFASGGNGGAIQLDGDSPATIEDDDFTDNVADNFGGAVSVEYITFPEVNSQATGDPRVTLSDNQFGITDDANRTGFGGRGGAAYVVSIGDTDIVGNNFEENQSPDGSGGGLYAIGNGPIDLADNDFSGNTAAAKGGGATLRVCSTATATDNSFEDNTLTRPLSLLVSTSEFSPGGGPMGGGLHMAYDPRRCELFNPPVQTAAAADSDFDVVQSGNHYSGNEIEDTFDSDLHGTGGGEGTQDLSVKSTNDTFVKNVIHTPNGDGGGMGSQNTGSYVVEARNLVAAGNQTISEPVEVEGQVQSTQEQPDGEGGGVYFGATQPGELRLFDSTVVSNQAAEGSGVAGERCDALTLHNGIVHDNTGSGDEEISGFVPACGADQPKAFALPGARDVRFSDVCVNGAAHSGVGNICANPLLADGSTGDVHQTGNSPTLNNGSNGLVPSDVTRDWEGQARIAGTVDMGADEAPAVAATTTPPPTPAATPGCLNAGGNLSGKTLGPAKLGRDQTSQREIFKGAKLRTRKGLDKYCAVPKGWFRIGYPNARLFKGYGRSLKNKTRKRVVLILTSSPRFSLKGITRGMKRATAKRKLKPQKSFVIGANRWYIRRTTGKRVLLVKVQTGLVREIGVGDRRFATTNKKLRAYLRAWEGGL